MKKGQMGFVFLSFSGQFNFYVGLADSKMILADS